MSERRPRGYLTFDIHRLVRQLATGEVEVDSSVPMTPAAIARLLVEVEGLDKEDTPSTGAVTAIIKRWERIGYITCDVNPYRFIEFTEEATTKGLDQLEEEFAAAGGKHSNPVDPEKKKARLAKRANAFVSMMDRSAELDRLRNPTAKISDEILDIL